jgi:hypothetical protein
LVPLTVRRDAGFSVTGLIDVILVSMGQWIATQGAFVISRRGTISRPARSPDLSVCDYFLWAYLKSKVYLKKSRDIDELMNVIREEITATPYSIVREAMRTLRDRLEQCRGDGGKRLRGVLFKNKISKCSDVVYFNGIFFLFSIQKIQI